MRAPYIHVGYHRTASTFLQQQVFTAMPLNCIVQPDLDELVMFEDFDRAAWLDRFERRHPIDPTRETIISHEMLSGTPEGEEPHRRARNAERLRALFPDARIIVVVRRQPDYVLSVYGYRVLIRGLETRSLETFLAEHHDAFTESLQYDVLVQHYVELFGSSRVLVLPFEQLAKDSDALIARLLEFMSLSHPVHYSRDRVNESTRDRRIIALNRLVNLPFDLTLGELRRRGRIAHASYLRWARPYFAFKERMLNPMLRRIADSRRARLELPASWLERMTPLFAASNRRLATLSGIDLASYGYIT
ncbi:MAG TPA: sulfotransferase [Kofleriaceae bacterium]|nr:sulfotransferase [Kofleriaceae bacterium]